MNSIESNFVPYHIALDMKSIGFDEPCLAQYSKYDVGEATLDIGFSKNEIISKFDNLVLFCSTPLYQQAFRWFRERYSLYINLIYDWNDEVYRVTIMMQNEDKSCKVIYLKEGDYIKEYKTLEEAEIECLIKLIELCKK